jgi:trimeric autotransporter adhesin
MKTTAIAIGIGVRAATILSLLMATSPARAQCEPEWRPFDPSTASYPGANGVVRATAIWDPDGPGPQTPKLVVGGTFTIVGDTFAHNIAWLDPETGACSPLGSGLTGPGTAVVTSLATLPSGELVAGGHFTSAGGVSVSNIARWNGSAWSTLGEGLQSVFDLGVATLAVLPSGDLVAGGWFEKAGNVRVNHIARWDGTSWSAMQGGVNGAVYALATLPSGHLVAGGLFTTAGGTPAQHIAQWDGSSWSPLGLGLTGTPYPFVAALAVLPSGDLYVGGWFSKAGSLNVKNIAHWNGSKWLPLLSGLNERVWDLEVLPSGDLVAAGNFTLAGSVSTSHIARWDGASWSGLGSGTDGWIDALAVLPRGDLVAGGVFSSAGGVGAKRIARWDGTGWSALAPGVSDWVYALAATSSGHLVAGGAFTHMGGTHANRIARWDGSTWSALGTGMNGPDALWVRTLASLPSGDIVAGGAFTTVGGTNVNYIARWDGSVWSPMGNGMSSIVRALAVLPSGDLIAGGDFGYAGSLAVQRIARWNGTSWSALGSGVSGGNPTRVRAILALPSGALVAGGKFSVAGGGAAVNIARWNGSSWSPLGPGLGKPYASDEVLALATLSSGDLVAAGLFANAGGTSTLNIARWDGASWSPLGSGLNHAVWALAVLPDDSLVAGGDFTHAGGVSTNYVARWDGSWWSPLQDGLAGSVNFQNGVRSLVKLPSGDLVAGGYFDTASSVVAPNIARWGCTTPKCYADCNASGSLNVHDFVCFQTLYALGEPKADCDANGELNIDDFFCFQTLYAMGC